MGAVVGFGKLHLAPAQPPLLAGLHSWLEKGALGDSTTLSPQRPRDAMVLRWLSVLWRQTDSSSTLRIRKKTNKWWGRGTEREKGGRRERSGAGKKKGKRKKEDTEKGSEGKKKKKTEK